AERVLFFNSDYDSKIAGLYDLQHTIGRGHYAVVKLACHVFTGEKVAVKVIDKTKLDDISQDHLFQEVVCMKLVQHPNVVRLYEVIDTPAKLYLILELGDGGDLYDYIMKHGCGLHETVAKRYFRQIVTAIAYCHKLHVVHRDLKPENVVFFEKLGLVKLTDFGFSNRFTPGMQLDTACGSLAYSAPEILLGDPYDAPKVDIWSLGVILYMLVCGRLPFQEVNDSETVMKIMDCDYTIPDYLSPDCARLISRLLIREPEKRAHLDDILQAEWLKVDRDDELPIDLFSVPLVSRECLPFEDHMEILTKMSEGQLATVEEIQSTLDRNEYNHIAATYYLLAERKLKRNYIEQYKLLAHQAQLNEKLRQQHALQQVQQQQICGVVDKTRSVQPGETSGKAANNNCSIPSGGGRLVGQLGQTTNQTTVQSTEERVRRFSMILEDEEEEEEEAAAANEEQKNKMISTLSRYLAEEYANAGLTDSTGLDGLPCLSDASAEALLEEEEEELLTVANLACVRSDLVTDQSANAVALTSTCFSENNPSVAPLTRPCSRVSGYGIETSDGAESDVSLSNWSTGGSSFIGSFPQASAVARSLPPMELRRKPYYRRGTIPHRPLISVKSSPQLLKHITEEEWNGSISCGDKSATFATNKLDHEFDRASSSRQSKNVLSYDSGGARSLRTSFNIRTNPLSADDHSIGLRSRLSWIGQRALSTTHSPTRTRRFFTSTGLTSRPTSIESWSAAFNMSLLNDFRRRSVCSSPVEHVIGLGTILKRKPHSFVYQPQGQNIGGRTQLNDRRCSGPPSLMLAVANFYHNAAVPAPSRSGSNTSFSESHDPPNEPATDRLNGVSGAHYSFDKSLCDKNSTDFQASFWSSATSPTPDVPKTTAHHSKPTACENDTRSASNSERHSPTYALSTPQRRAITRSPHRAFSSAHRAASWCSSAPMLCETEPTSNIDTSSSGSISTPPKTGLTVISGSAFTAPGVATLREYCAPIREEEDEVRLGDPGLRAYSGGNSSLDRRRCSESPSVRDTTSLLTNCIPHTVGADSPSAVNHHSVLGDVNPAYSHFDRFGPLSQLTTSNFSLSSLAMNLRDSRHMLDVVRGTFELQCHYNRRTGGGSVAGGSSSGYPSGRASASASVRSLTAVSENMPINTGLKSDIPSHSSRRLAHIRAGLSHDSSFCRVPSSGRRVLSPRRSATLTANMQANPINLMMRADAYNSDRFSMPTEMMNGFELDQSHHMHRALNRPFLEHLSHEEVDTQHNLVTLVNEATQHSSVLGNGPVTTLECKTPGGLCNTPAHVTPSRGDNLQPTGTRIGGSQSDALSANSNRIKTHLIPASLVGFDTDGDLNLIGPHRYQPRLNRSDDDNLHHRFYQSVADSSGSNNNNSNGNDSSNGKCNADELHPSDSTVSTTHLRLIKNSSERHFISSLTTKNHPRLACCTIS
ncbi:SNF related kinase, partial [Paragonimus westermani]